MCLTLTFVRLRGDFGGLMSVISRDKKLIRGHGHVALNYLLMEYFVLVPADLSEDSIQQKEKLSQDHLVLGVTSRHCFYQNPFPKERSKGSCGIVSVKTNIKHSVFKSRIVRRLKRNYVGFQVHVLKRCRFS